MTTDNQTLQPIDVLISKLVYGGDGLGRLPTGEVVFVPFTAPDETVQIVVSPRRNKQVHHGDLQAVITASPDRVEPPCSVFGQCGGCQWQHLSGPAQRHWKQTIVEETLRRIGKLTEVPISPILGSVEGEWHYRNKVEWVVEQSASGPVLGYHRFHSHHVVSFETCWIIPPRFSVLADWLRARPALLTGLDRIQLRVNTAGEWLLTGFGTDDSLSDWNQQQADCLEAFPEVVGIVLSGEDEASSHLVYGQAFLVEELLGKRFQVSVHSFFQVNNRMAAALVKTAGDMLLPDLTDWVDLYAGVGLFSVALAQSHQTVTAVESSPSAIGDALINIQNAQQNGAGQIEVVHQSVHTWLTAEDTPISAVLLDPPRSGCTPEILEALVQRVTRQILYVSCDPATLARDIRHLAGAGWSVSAVQPLDLFPQTFHIETIVSLVKSPADSGIADQ